MVKKTALIGGITYLLPFKADHCGVTDARGHNVCEACNPLVAGAIAKTLNQESGYGQR